jgi:uroporphyrinogen-III synthase
LPRVFLSRALADKSPFVALTSQPGWEITALSLLEFEGVPFQDLPEADWLFFYSSKGVQFFFQQRVPPDQLKLATIGPGTAKELEARGYQAAFVGQGSPATVAAAFLTVAAGQGVIFVQARQSRKSVQLALDQQIDGIDLIVYDNVPRPRLIVPDNDYLIFTSPLNFETYRQCNRINPKQRLIGIGPTTEKSFQWAGIENYRIASQPTESALLSCLLKWQQELPV